MFRWCIGPLNETLLRSAIIIMLVICFITLLLSFMAGIAVVKHSAKLEMQKEAIEYGCVYYNPKTKEFTWRDMK
jgi:heme/copper-type cytochrome/quinol oxidase subunit 2